ncbi:hypothetical protein TNCV_1931421 [Trichonephila clavipes]|nr:hypothetical protein TNCV_1931421 [Trichonephila clavipes]
MVPLKEDTLQPTFVKLLEGLLKHFITYSRNTSCGAPFTSSDDTKRHLCKYLFIDGGTDKCHMELSLVNMGDVETIVAIYGQLVASNGSVAHSRGLNLVIGHAEATPNKLFISSPTRNFLAVSPGLVTV